ncbi:sn-glycerol-3-phosphate import ATP-binding protein UgpC [soil metagenome]
MATISMDGLQKTYHGASEPAVKGISLDIADGELIVLVGPSGCGKSTLLRMVAGLETITAGTLRIGERVVNTMEPADRDIAMVFQNYALYPHMSVYGNLAYGLRNRKFRRDEIERRVRLAADMLQIGDFLARKPRQLSGGQRQRVAMGRALVREPSAFLFDEPLSNLDAKLRVQMRVEIRRLQRRLKTTSLYVTHDQLEALTLADRLVVLSEGAIEQLGTPSEVYDRPQTLFVAAFIGSPAMNFIPTAYLRERANGQLPNTLAAAADILGVRPDALLLAEPAEPSIALPATLELVEPAGDVTHLYLRLEGIAEPITARVQGRPPLEEGAPMTLWVRHADFHPFDEETGRRV